METIKDGPGGWGSISSDGVDQDRNEFRGDQELLVGVSSSLWGGGQRTR